MLNAISDLPLALGNIASDLENMDLITPNRLKLGRNNERSPVSPMKVVGNHLKVLEENKKIFNVWFETRLILHVPKLMDQPKWFCSDRDGKICDVVLFIKTDDSVVNTYQYGMVSEIELSRDGLIRKVVIKYRKSSENIDRFTTRAVRELVLIHQVDEMHIMEELGKVATTSSIRGGSRDSEKGDALGRLPWLVDQENFRFQMVLEFSLSKLVLVAAVFRRMIKNRVTLGNISRVLLNLFKRLIFVMFKDSSSLLKFPQLTFIFSL